MIYVFHRAEGFYPVEISSEAEVSDHVALNPGTVKVTEALSGKIIFQAPSEPQP